MAKSGRKKSPVEIKLYSMKFPTNLISQVDGYSGKYKRTQSVIQAIKEWLERKKK